MFSLAAAESEKLSSQVDCPQRPDPTGTHNAAKVRGLVPAPGGMRLM